MKANESERMIWQRKVTGDSRSKEEITEHYELEVKLAAQLRAAAREERRVLYTAAYDDLFSALPHHPQLVRKADDTERETAYHQKLALVGRYISAKTVLLEVGSGDGSFATRIASLVRQVYAVDVSSRITESGQALPKNFELVLSDGSTVPLPTESVDIAYSNQLMEHLHPDDAMFQLKEIHRVLKRGGRYICITPSRYAGPHDVSGFFDAEARGFHLREYTTTELTDMFRSAGLSDFHVYAGGKGYYIRIPERLARLVDKAIASFHPRVRHRVANLLPARALLGVVLVGHKR